MIDYFFSLPCELVVEIVFDLPLAVTLKFCNINYYLYDIIWNNNLFWRQKFIQKYKTLDYSIDTWNNTSQSKFENWRELFRDYSNVWAFGDNSQSQLGSSHMICKTTVPIQLMNIRGRNVSADGDSTIIQDWHNNIYTFGNNGHHQLDFSDRNDLKVEHISLGLQHTTAIDTRNNVWVMGNNESGQLGLGHYFFY